MCDERNAEQCGQDLADKGDDRLYLFYVQTEQCTVVDGPEHQHDVAIDVAVHGQSFVYGKKQKSKEGEEVIGTGEQRGAAVACQKPGTANEHAGYGWINGGNRPKEPRQQ